MFFFRARRDIRLGSTLIVFMTLLLGACTTLPGSMQVDPSIASASRIYHPAIAMEGRLSVRYQSRGEEESLHGSFTWDQLSEHIVVTLLSPLGQTLARIEITPHSATLLQPGQPPRIAQDVNELTAAALGWPLPVAGLQTWLQGFVETPSGRGLTTVPAENAVIDTPDGWRLHYVSWQQNGQAHPRRIDLERETAQAGEVSLRIVVDRWQPRG
jgi:outer membrane lipoprotein LolB